MDPKVTKNWQENDLSFFFLVGVFSITVCFIGADALIKMGSQPEAFLTLVILFGLVGPFLSVMAIGYKKPKLATVGSYLWAAAFMLTSIAFSDYMSSSIAGIAMRVGATSLIAFSVAQYFFIKTTDKQKTPDDKVRLTRLEQGAQLAGILELLSTGKQLQTILTSLPHQKNTIAADGWNKVDRGGKSKLSEILAQSELFDGDIVDFVSIVEIEQGLSDLSKSILGYVNQSNP